MRYFVAFSYFGEPYHGWQKQPNAITVQEVLETAFSTLLRETIVLMGAGRTDAGVHAKQMYAHFNFEQPIVIDDLVYKLNAFLPDAIAVHGIYEVPEDAHARFNASARTYEYWVTTSKNPFYDTAAYYVKYPLDVALMNKAAEIIASYIDFECFSKSNTDVNTFLCTITKAEWEVKEDRLVFTITANRFLRNMVRAIVGTLLDVGTGRSTLENVKKIIESKNRSEAGRSVPAKGLYLTKIEYPSHIKL